MSSPTASLRAIKSAVRVGNWRPDPHLLKQLAKRGLVLVDVLAAVVSAKKIVPHDMRPLNEGGESWRVYGADTDGRQFGVGVELLREDDGDFVVIITAFLKEKQ